MHKDIEVQAMSGFQYAETLQLFCCRLLVGSVTYFQESWKLDWRRGCFPWLSTKGTVGVAPELVGPDPRLAPPAVHFKKRWEPTG